MFTGIVQEIGKIVLIRKRSEVWELSVRTDHLYQQAEVSDSIAVNGVCLTVVKKDKNVLVFEAVKPTVNLTGIKRLRTGSLVNLEPALKAGDKLGGHYVLGHVDCEARIKMISKAGGYHVFSIEYPSQYGLLLVDKGSVAVDGISLTLARVVPGYFILNIIPHTYDQTILKYKRPGDRVNLEFDYLLKSVQKS